MNTGLIIEPPKETDFIFGAQKLGDFPLQSDANWSGFLPDIEQQQLNGVETYACVTFTTLSIVEILERRIYGATSNWSDRFLSAISGTKEKQGNTPANVAEILRKQGVVPEKDYPFDVNTYEKFYAPVPSNLKTLAIAFIAEYSFGYEHVPSDYDAMMEALTYSPLAFSAYAWVKDSDGLYYRPQGMTDNHLTICYGYVRNNYWLIWDSYISDGTPFKKVKWNSLPMQCKRYTLLRQIVVESFWQKFINWLRSAYA